MHIGLFRNLAPAQLASLQGEFPACEFHLAGTVSEISLHLELIDVLFGNAPLESVLSAPRLRWLQIVSSGFDAYLPLRDRQLALTTGAGVHAPIIAQHFLLMFLMFVRGQPHFSRCQIDRRWDRQPSLPQNPANLTVGIVGYGAIGQAIAKLLTPLGVKVIAAKRAPQGAPRELHELLPWERLNDLLGQADHVVLTLPHTPETVKTIDASRLDHMKRGSILHNVSRGSLVDEKALTNLLQTGQLGGAALDVFADEPLPVESPLWQMPNVIITPHIAGHHADLGELMLNRFKQNLRRYLQGKPLLHVANFERGY